MTPTLQTVGQLFRLYLQESSDGRGGRSTLLVLEDALREIGLDHVADDLHEPEVLGSYSRAIEALAVLFAPDSRARTYVAGCGTSIVRSYAEMTLTHSSAVPFRFRRLVFAPTPKPGALIVRSVIAGVYMLLPDPEGVDASLFGIHAPNPLYFSEEDGVVLMPNVPVRVQIVSTCDAGIAVRCHVIGDAISLETPTRVSARTPRRDEHGVWELHNVDGDPPGSWTEDDED